MVYLSQPCVANLCPSDFISNAKMYDNIWLTPKNTIKNSDRRPPKEHKARPFLKWAGGKSQLLDEIRQYYPPELGKGVNKYAEPFIGGGAVLFDVLNNYDIDEVYISDSNTALINVYTVLQKSAEGLIALLEEYEEEFLPLGNEQRKTMYYEKRSRYNTLKRSGIQNAELAALFIFLNRTCFNGLYRVNSKGEYNVPMGAYRMPTICDEENLRNAAKALQNVIIRCADYRQSEAFIDDHTFVYFDPPYRPLSASANFTAYTENDFDDKCQTELACFIRKLSDAGAYIVASNSDPKNTNINDDFFDVLYEGMEINRIHATRMINSNASARGKISELLICNRNVRGFAKEI